MPRLNLTVEGLTEQNFAVRLLKGHLAGFGVYLCKPRCTALARKKGRVHRGGVRSYAALKNDLRRWLAEEHGRDVFFSTMVDLYALPADLPGYGEAKEMNDPYQRVEHLEKSLCEDFGDPRLVAYIQLHEFEALLFTDPTAFGRHFLGVERAVGALREVQAAFANPEWIDDGEQTAPSKRIEREIPAYPRMKATAGPAVAELIGLTAMRSACPHFDQWLTRLERLGAGT